jgi:hypothetical protein
VPTALGCHNIYMGVEDNVSQQLRPLFEDPPEWKLPQQQKDELYAAQRTVGGLVAKRGLPEGYEITARHPDKHFYNPQGEKTKWGGDMQLTHRGTLVGSVQWDYNTGHVSWLGVDEGHRHVTHHLLDAAHKLSVKQGGIGPLKSDIMSHQSGLLAKKFAPSSIPARATIAPHPNDYEEWSSMEQHPITEAIDRASNSLLHAHMELGRTYTNPDIGQIPDNSPAWGIADHLNGVQDTLTEARHDFYDARNPAKAIETMHKAADALENHPSYSLDAPHGLYVGIAIRHLRDVS